MNLLSCEKENLRIDPKPVGILSCEDLNGLTSVTYELFAETFIQTKYELLLTSKYLNREMHEMAFRRSGNFLISKSIYREKDGNIKSEEYNYGWKD